MSTHCRVLTIRVSSRRLSNIFIISHRSIRYQQQWWSLRGMYRWLARKSFSWSCMATLQTAECADTGFSSKTSTHSNLESNISSPYYSPVWSLNHRSSSLSLVNLEGCYISDAIDETTELATKRTVGPNRFDYSCLLCRSPRSSFFVFYLYLWCKQSDASIRSP